MNNPKHTPGSWIITDLYDISPNGGPIAYHIAGERMVAETLSHEATDKANARLMSAVPELLEAAKESLYLLKSLTGDALSGTDCAKGKTMLRNAIAKAEGK